MRIFFLSAVLLFMAGCAYTGNNVDVVIQKYSTPSADIPWDLVIDTEEFWEDIDILYKAGLNGNIEAIRTLLVIGTFTDGATGEGMPDLFELIKPHKEAVKKIVLNDARLKSNFAHWFQD